MKKHTLYKITVTFLLITLTGSLFAASTITGKVKADASGSPLPGVNIQIQGTTTATITDMNGNYFLSVTTGVQITLVCSIIGYSTLYKTITPVTGTNTVDFWFNPPPPPSAIISGTTTVCKNSASPNITFTGSGGTAPYTFTYKINSGSNLTVTTSSGSSVTVSAPTTTEGTYIYSLVSVGDIYSTVAISGSATVTVSPIPAAPTIAAGSSTTFCSGGSVTLTSSTGSSYLWSNSATTASINVTSAGSYTVRITNSSGCMSASSAATVVTVNSLPATPTISASGPTSLCTGGNVTLSSSAGTSYLWSNNATTASINVTSAGNYTVRVTNSNGCQSAVSAATAVTVNSIPATPTISAGGPTTFCADASVTLTSSSGTSYLWSTGATTPSINVTSTGSYTVQVTNSGGCLSAASSATAVTVNSLPAIPAISASGPTSLCAGGSVTLTSSAGTSYLWSNNATTASINVASAGSYTVRITNANGCQSASSAVTVVTVNPQPSAPVPGVITQPKCSSETGSVVLSGLPPAGTWTLTRSVDLVTTTGTGVSSTISGIPAGTYTYTVTDASGCISVSSSNVVITTGAPTPSAPAAGTITQPTCPMPSGTIVLNGLPVTGTWTLTRTPGGITTTGTGTNSTITGLSSGTYTYTVTNASGCISTTSANIVILVLKPGVIPKIKAKWADILVCSNKGDSIASYQWYKGTSIITNATNQYFVTNKQSGIYKVETIDKNGCRNFSNNISIGGAKSVSVFPNPASESFSIKVEDESEGSAFVSIINSSGIKVMEFEAEIVKDELLKTIPVSKLEEGVYIVRVVLKNKDLYSTKLIVKK
jgi:hypothetical protein